ncbi:glycoside-pentoside-hexuronide (GPH):cation symporter [Thalassotalea fonticola]|uniref:Glycoside-pentoside-hexuronide (GPH):cation symporter n=1 Tax=Thalassotalea fonticola TaxID=3065649 RepID=A0ABZ0GL82_9GAMM|nr:glycoside-pentoside-hexuronide (GPH):cation symporter [Colwelliaceae bacterium S1-1]
MTQSNIKLSVTEKLGYGMGDAASNIIFQTVMTFLAFFYTDIFGISAAAVGTLFLSVRLLDAITDPVMGAVADRTETKWGKYRPYLVWLCIPYAAICILTFTTPDWSENAKLVYAFVTYGLLMIMYTAINIPYCALGGVLTSDPKERVSIQSYRFALASLAGIMITAFTLPLVDFFGNGDKAQGYQFTIILMSMIGVGLFIICFATTKERIPSPKRADYSIKHDLKMLLKNDQWIVVGIITFIVMFAVILRATVSLYYVNYVLNRPDLATAFVTTGMVGMFLGTLFAKPITDKFCKVKVYSYTTLTIACLCFALYFLDNSYVLLAFGFQFLIGFLQQMTTPIIWVMMTDTVDYGELKTGERMTAFTFSGSLFILKLGMSVAGAIAGWILAFYGYQGAEQQTERALEGINLLFTIIPATASLIAFGLVRKYKLNNVQLKNIQQQLSARPDMTMERA